MKRYKFQLATSKQASEMVEFHNKYYEAMRSSDDWLWEYKTYNPERAVTSFAKDGEKIIATQGMIPIYMRIGTETILTGKSESTLLLPEYRGTSIMQELYEYAVDHCINNGMQFIWGLTPAVKAFEKFGFKSYPDIQCMIRPGNISDAIRLRLEQRSPSWHRIGSIMKLILKHLLLYKRTPTNHYHEESNHKLRRGITERGCLKLLFDRLALRHKNEIFLNFDQEYLKWRVREHPFISYDEYQVYNQGDLKAFAIVTLNKRVLSISNLTSEDEKATTFLLYRIYEDYYKYSAEFRFLVNAKDILSIHILNQLNNFGFSARGKTNLIVRDLSKNNNEEIYHISNWHINGLWTEGYSM